MDTKDWILLIAGASIGFVLSIVANLTTPQFGNLFQKGRATWVERNKGRAVKQYKKIMRFRSGAEDKYMYFVAQWGFIVAMTVLGTAFGTLGALSNSQADRILKISAA